MQRKISVKYIYHGQLCAGEETDPRIFAYFSRDLGVSSWYKELGASPVSMGTIDLEIPEDRFGGERIAQDAAFSCCIFVSTRNHSGEWCGNEAGALSIGLKDVYENTKLGATYRVKAPLVVHASIGRTEDGVPVTKGEMELFFNGKCFNVQGQSPTASTIRSPFSVPRPYDYMEVNAPLIRATLQDYIGKSVSFYERVQPSWRSMSNIHAPIYRWNGYILPGSYYATHRPIEQSSERWWRNVLNIGIRRAYPRLSDKEAQTHFLNEASDQEVLTVMSFMHCVYSNYCCYLADGTVRNKEWMRINYGAVQQGKGAIEKIMMESFSNTLRIRGLLGKFHPPGGDCEDFALEQAMQSIELKFASGWSDPLLLKTQRVRKSQLYLMTLKGVCGAKLEDGKINAPFDNLGGHMDGTYVSVQQFANECVNQDVVPFLLAQSIATEGKPSPAATTNINATQILVSEPPPPVAMKLRKQAMEGTGLMHPDGRIEDEIVYAAYIAKGTGEAFKDVKRINIQNPTKMNAFYRAVQSAFIPDFVESGYTSFEGAYLQLKDESSISASVDYQKFINDDSNVVVRMQPSMTIEQKRIFDNETKYFTPVPAFLDPVASDAQLGDVEGRFRDKLERVKEKLRKWKRKVFHRKDVANTSVQNFFLRYDQVTNKRMADWARIIEERPKIFDFDFIHESVTPGVGGYMCTFLVDKSAKAPEGFKVGNHFIGSESLFGDDFEGESNTNYFDVSESSWLDLSSLSLYK